MAPLSNGVGRKLLEMNRSARFSLALMLDPTASGCLVVGGGPVALRRTRNLLAAGASVVVVATRLCEDFQELQASVNDGRLRVSQREFDWRDLDGIGILVVAIDDATYASEIGLRAMRSVPLVCNATVSEAGNVAFPAVFAAEDLLISVSSKGKDPGLAAFVKDLIRKSLPRDIRGLYESHKSH